jgi:addiction module RelB/DinJ family antitoxin
MADSENFLLLPTRPINHRLWDALNLLSQQDTIHCHYTTATFWTMKMTTSTMYQFRIDPKEKAEAFAVIESLGLKPAQAMRLFLRQVIQTHSIPFPIEHTPNERTAKLLLMPDDQKGYERFSSVEGLIADLND